ncbi:peroxisomal 2,4-dienoyl-CoA reductase [(3E)-enoyl-CoA-producing] [Elephas maximus indicus]|uniref:peroxisomal 2,4-dienoyl-CoA reductase [(3E)-enoyl-CoA-producing] n=1 Tax=Elephas maximus indicus TaxID=99487 RepID=UPI0021160415|nr:peroxisomal 2,4-dienoyl-CoA reductase [(3E)-enoyl-CoA-producing] [Elephas maximus indicus]
MKGRDLYDHKEGHCGRWHWAARRFKAQICPRRPPLNRKPSVRCARPTNPPEKDAVQVHVVRPPLHRRGRNGLPRRNTPALITRLQSQKEQGRVGRGGRVRPGVRRGAEHLRRGLAEGERRGVRGKPSADPGGRHLSVLQKLVNRPQPGPRCPRRLHRGHGQPPPDIDEDDCLLEYCHLFCPVFVPFRDKVAFIIGGGSEIGFLIAQVFMRHSCHMVIASRSLPRVSTASKKLVAAKGQWCLPLSLDVQDPPTIIVAVDEVLREFGKMDILVNGAAGNFPCPASTLSFNAFKTVLDIDAAGIFNVSHVLYEKFFRDHGGVIVNITATLGSWGQVLLIHAGAAKAAMDAMMCHLAVEWGHGNIRVNILAPGLISGTKGFQQLGGPQASRILHFLRSPLQRAGNKMIAHSALFLASPAASFVTGAVLVANGGMWLTSPNNTEILVGFPFFPTKL